MRARGFALVFLALAFALGVPACNFFNDYGNLWSTANGCCPPALPSFFDCLVFMDPTVPLGGALTNGGCTVYLGQCFADQADAVRRAEAYALSTHPHAQVAGAPKTKCTPGTCGQVLKAPQDYPSCNAIVPVDAGASCFPGTDPCTTCLSTCCAEYDVCVSNAPPDTCDAMVNYWQGVGPAASGQASPAVADLDTCFTNAGCNDVSICGAKARGPSPGGL